MAERHADTSIHSTRTDFSPKTRPAATEKAVPADLLLAKGQGVLGVTSLGDGANRREHVKLKKSDFATSRAAEEEYLSAQGAVDFYAPSTDEAVGVDAADAAASAQSSGAAGVAGAGAAAASGAAASAAATGTTSGLFGSAVAAVGGIGTGGVLAGGALVAAAAAGGGGNSAAASTSGPVFNPNAAPAPLKVSLNGNDFMNAEASTPLFKDKTLVITSDKTLDPKTLMIVDRGNNPLAGLTAAEPANNYVNAFQSLPDGEYFIVGKFTDGSFSSRFSFIKDTTPPDLSALGKVGRFTIELDAASDSGKLGDGVTNSLDPVIKGFVRDTSVVSIKIYDVSDLSTALATSPVENGFFSLGVSLKNLSGLYGFVVTGVDKFGNETLPENGLNFAVTLDLVEQTLTLNETGVDFTQASDNRVSVAQIENAAGSDRSVELLLSGINANVTKIVITAVVSKTISTKGFSFELTDVNFSDPVLDEITGENVYTIKLDSIDFLNQLAQAAPAGFDISDFPAGIPVRFDASAFYPGGLVQPSSVSMVIDAGVVPLAGDAIKLSGLLRNGGVAYINSKFEGAPGDKLVTLSVATPVSEKGFKIDSVYVYSSSQQADQPLQEAVSVQGSNGFYRFDPNLFPAAAQGEFADVLVVVIASDAAGNQQAFYLDKAGKAVLLPVSGAFSEENVRANIIERVQSELPFDDYSARIDFDNVINLRDIQNLDTRSAAFNNDSVTAINTEGALSILLRDDVIADKSLVSVSGLRKDGQQATYSLKFVGVQTEPVSGQRIARFAFQDGSKLSDFINENLDGVELNDKTVQVKIRTLDLAGNQTDETIPVSLDMIAPTSSVSVVISPLSGFVDGSLKVLYQVRPIRGAIDLQKISMEVTGDHGNVADPEFDARASGTTVRSDSLQVKNAAVTTVVFNVADDVGNDAKTNSIEVDSLQVLKTHSTKGTSNYVLAGEANGGSTVDVLVGLKNDHATLFKNIGVGDYAIGADKLVDAPSNPALEIGDVFVLSTLDFAGVYGRDGNSDTVNFQTGKGQFSLTGLNTALPISQTESVKGVLHGVEVLDFTDGINNTVMLDVALLDKLNDASSSFIAGESAKVANIFLTTFDEAVTPGQAGLLGFGGSNPTISPLDSIKFAEKVSGMAASTNDMSQKSIWFRVSESGAGNRTTKSVFAATGTGADADTIGERTSQDADGFGYSRWQYNDANGNAVVSVWIRDGMTVTGAA